MNEKGYIFVLGKNTSLSLAEIRELAATRGRFAIKHIEYGEDTSWALVSSTDDVSKIQEILGGTTKIVEVAWTGKKKIKNIRKDITNIANRLGIGDRQYKSMITHLCEKVATLRPNVEMIGISLYFREKAAARAARWRSLAEHVVREIAQSLDVRGINATVVTPKVLARTKNYFPPFLSRKKGFHEKNAEIAIFLGDMVTAGVVVAIYDGKSEKKRGDVLSRPVGWKYGIRPRMARIIVNLAHVLPGKNVLDPFCGIGTLLNEALILGGHVAGVDINNENVKSTIENLKRTREMFKQGEIIGIYECDARKLPFRNGLFDCIVTEPYLGEPYKSPPTPDAADHSLKKYLELMIGALPEMKRVMKTGGRAVVIAPRIKTTKGFVRIPFEQIAQKNNFKHHYMILDGENWQVVWREIHVLTA